MLILLVWNTASANVDTSYFRDRFPGDIATLEQLNALASERQKLAWMFRDIGGMLGPDPAGITISEYADARMFSPQFESQLAALRTKAEAQKHANDASGLAITFREATSFAKTQFWTARALMSYATMLEILKAHQRALTAMLDRTLEAERKPTLDRIKPLVAKIPEFLQKSLNLKSPGQESDAMRMWNDYAAVFNVFNEERQRLAPYVSATELAIGVVPRSRTRKSACPTQPHKSSGSDTARLDMDSIVKPAYPKNAVRYFFEGLVAMVASISATGCLERVELARTTGIDELDAVALEWAENINFFPAEKDGQPIGSSLKFEYLFKLEE